MSPREAEAEATDQIPEGGGGALGGRLLRLLSENAPLSEYETALNACATESAGGLLPLVGDALRVRNQLEERRRNEAEFAALYETAGTLFSLRDLEAVCHAIVRLARSLLTTDAAYLMLCDPAREDTYVRATDGIRTEAFTRVRLATGTGLAGLVAATALPHATGDYLEDSRFEHTVDDVVREEGLASIQGVPLSLGERVVGVLLVAHRRVRPFSRHEVELLTSFARHAALAMENATLLQEARRPADELSEACALIRAHSASLAHASDLHERLTALVWDGGDLSQVTDTLREMVHGSVLIVDPRGDVLAAAGEDPLTERARAEGTLPEQGPTAQAARQACVLSIDARRTRRVPAGDAGWGACATPIVAGGEVLGVLLLLRDHLTSSDARSLERAAPVTAVMLLSARTVAEAERRLRGEILEDLLDRPPGDLEGLRRRVTLVGLDLDRSPTVLTARCRDSLYRGRILDAAAAYATRAGGLAGGYRGDVVLLLPGEPDAVQVARTVAEYLSRSVRAAVTVGAATAATGVDAIVEAHHDATRCLDVLLALDRDGEGASSVELGVYGLLFHRADRDCCTVSSAGPSARSWSTTLSARGIWSVPSSATSSATAMSPARPAASVSTSTRCTSVSTG